MLTGTEQGTDTKAQGDATIAKAKAGAEIAPTDLDEKSTGKSFDEKDFQRAVTKATQSTQKQLDLKVAEAKKSQSEADAAKAQLESMNSELADLRKEMDNLTESRFADDPDALQAYRSKKELDKMRAEIKKREAEAERKFYDAEKLAWSARMAQKADSLHKETGIEMSELAECQTEEEMEVKALRYVLAHPKGEAEPEEETPKFAGGGSGRGTGGWRNLSPEGKIAYGLKNKK